MPGPVPKPADQRRRRNKPTENRVLPVDGRVGPTPKWPLSKQRAGESSMWRSLWETPQADAWEDLGWTWTVARYCRLSIAADKPDAPVSLHAELRQIEFALGLTPMAMLRLRWSIGEVAESSATTSGDGVVVTPDRWKRSG